MHKVIEPGELSSVVAAAVAAQPVVDLHTHLYSPAFGTPVASASAQTDPKGLLLWGVDELVTYHYLVAEVFRVVPASQMPYEQFWKMSKRQQADHIWKHLFVQRSPVSEACRGVLTVLQRLGFDLSSRTLDEPRRYFAAQDVSRHIDRVMQVAGVERLTMTNEVFDENERSRWLANPSLGSDDRFRAVVRIDLMLRDWPAAAKKLTQWGYPAAAVPDDASIQQARRFLADWIDRTNAIYLAVSLPPEFRYPAGDAATDRAGQTLLEKAVLPVCSERGLPLAMMIGARRGANKALGDAGDMVGRADVTSVTNLCSQFPQNKFLVTMLSRENQHELCIAARKFGNLMLFGCWWFLNNPSMIEEMTRMRMETLGTSFIPQHSDARILEQIIYKWHHSRIVIGKVLVDKYADLLATGWKLTEDEVKKDVDRLLRSNFLGFLKQ